MQSVKPGRQLFTFDWPLETHWQAATCDEIGCPSWVTGFTTQLDESDEKLRDLADWLRHKSGMHYTESMDVEGLTTFTFPQGQQCWEGRAGMHRVKTGRPESLFQQTPVGTRTFTGEGRQLNECMNEEVYKVERISQGRR